VRQQVEGPHAPRGRSRDPGRVNVVALAQRDRLDELLRAGVAQPPAQRRRVDVDDVCERRRRGADVVDLVALDR